MTAKSSLSLSPKPHPQQELGVDAQGRLRFRENAIVSKLLDVASSVGFDMNAIAVMKFSDEDRVQFAQLIGYSLAGFGELHYVSDSDYEAACKQADALALDVALPASAPDNGGSATS